MTSCCPKCGTTWEENCQVSNREDFFVTRISELEDILQQLLPIAKKTASDPSEIALCSIAKLVLHQEVFGGNTNLLTGSISYGQISPN